MRLFKEDGELASLDDIIAWFNHIYPYSIFKTHPISIVRGLLNAIQRGALTNTTLSEKED